VNKKKNPVYKNEGREPIHQKYKANESRSRSNPKKKKTNNLKKKGKNCMQIGFIATK
jgi:hypothetical protein